MESPASEHLCELHIVDVCRVNYFSLTNDGCTARSQIRFCRARRWCNFSCDAFFYVVQVGDGLVLSHMVHMQPHLRVDFLWYRFGGGVFLRCVCVFEREARSLTHSLTRMLSRSFTHAFIQSCTRRPTSLLDHSLRQTLSLPLSLKLPVPRLQVPPRQAD